MRKPNPKYAKQHAYFARQRKLGWKHRSIMANDELWTLIKNTKAAYLKLRKQKELN